MEHIELQHCSCSDFSCFTVVDHSWCDDDFIVLILSKYWWLVQTILVTTCWNTVDALPVLHSTSIPTCHHVTVYCQFWSLCSLEGCWSAWALFINIYPQSNFASFWFHFGKHVLQTFPYLSYQCNIMYTFEIKWSFSAFFLLIDFFMKSIAKIYFWCWHWSNQWCHCWSSSIRISWEFWFNDQEYCNFWQFSTETLDVCFHMLFWSWMPLVIEIQSSVQWYHAVWRFVHCLKLISKTMQEIFMYWEKSDASPLSTISEVAFLWKHDDFSSVPIVMDNHFTCTHLAAALILPQFCFAMFQ